MIGNSNAVFRLALACDSDPQFINDSERVAHAAELAGISEQEVLQVISNFIEYRQKRRVTMRKALKQDDQNRLHTGGFAA